MNELTEAIAKRAAEYAIEFAKQDQELYIPKLMEKFAELVIRECAKFLDENSGYDDANNAWHPEPEDLLKHFGVNSNENS